MKRAKSRSVDFFDIDKIVHCSTCSKSSWIVLLLSSALWAHACLTCVSLLLIFPQGSQSCTPLLLLMRWTEWGDVISDYFCYTGWHGEPTSRFPVPTAVSPSPLSILSIDLIPDPHPSQCLSCRYYMALSIQQFIKVYCNRKAWVWLKYKIRKENSD